MIYTVTLNPSLDVVTNAENFERGKLNRGGKTYFCVGGKGINVSLVLTALGAENTALTFVAGRTGEVILSELQRLNQNCDFFTLPIGNSRINTKICDRQKNCETEINGCGPNLTEGSLAWLKEKLSALNTDDIAVFSGSIPKGAEKSLYFNLASAASPAKVIIDASGEAFCEALKAKPFLVKPNYNEICDFAKFCPQTEAELLKAMKAVQNAGAKNVLLSLGGNGARLLTENGEMLRQDAPEGKAVYTVGAGDSAVAGFIHGFKNGKHSYSYALHCAVAAGSATAFSQGLCSRTSFEKIFNSI